MKKVFILFLFLIIQNAVFSKETMPVFSNDGNLPKKSIGIDDADYYFTEYKKLKLKNKDEEAFEALKKAYSYNRANYEILSEIINYLLSKNDPNSAAKYFEQSLLINPEFEKSSEILAYISKVYFVSGDLKNALKYQLKAIELNEGESELYIDLGKIYLAQKNWLNSVNAFEYAITGDRIKDSECYNYIGIANVKRGNYSQAVQYFEKSVELNEGFKNLYNLAKTYHARKETDKYLATLNRIQISYLNSPDDYLHFALELEKINPKKALEVLEDGLNRYKNDQKLNQLYLKLNNF